MHVSHQSYQRHIRGDVGSWILGVLLGLSIGVLMLIVVPMWMSGALTPQPAAQAKASGKAGEAAKPADQPTGEAATAAATQVKAEDGKPTSTPVPANPTQQPPQPAQGAATAKPIAPQEMKKPEMNPPKPVPAPATPAPTPAKPAPAQPTSINTPAQPAASATKDASTIPTLAAKPASNGKELYLSRCSGCHVASGAGGIAPKLDQAAQLSVGAFVAAIKRAPMAAPDGAPNLAVHDLKLSDADLSAIHNYLGELY